MDEFLCHVYNYTHCIAVEILGSGRVASRKAYKLMIAYLLMPVLACISSLILFLPSELALLILANMNKVPLHAFGRELDISRFGTNFPWLLPIVAAIGSNVGSTIYYMMGAGSLRMSGKLKKRLEKFDFQRFGKARDTVVFISAITSVPPISLVAIASGVIKSPFARYFHITLAGKIIRYYLVLFLGRFALDLALKWVG